MIRTAITAMPTITAITTATATIAASAIAIGVIMVRRPARATAPPPPPPGLLSAGRYEENCHRGNAAAGTIFGALAGGLIGGAAPVMAMAAPWSAARSSAVCWAMPIGRDIDCDDQPAAFRVYADGLNGDIGRPYEWHNRNNYGYFTPVREFRRGDQVCRDFTETSLARRPAASPAPAPPAAKSARQLALRLTARSWLTAHHGPGLRTGAMIFCHPAAKSL